MDSKELRSLWEAYASVYTPQEVEEGVRDVDPEKGTAERKARLEKKRGMKLDDHPQYKKEEKDSFGRPGGKHGGVPKKGGGYDKAYQANMKKVKELEQKEEVEVAEARKPGESPKEYAARMTKKHSGGKSKTYDPMKDPNFDHDKAERTRGSMQELYKGKHGQSEKEYADSRSQGGKMVSGDSKGSGAEYTHGRRVKAANPGMQPDVGGKTKPKSQGKMDKGTRADLEYRKANLKKEDLDIFDTVLEYLQVEGIAESFEDAQWMMVNVLDEEDVDSILDEARRADKEGYARGSKENPKRKDIPHGDVSQRSMLHSKLKRRADEMGRARRSSARNKAGGRTPVGKKEKAFLQAVTRTAGQVRQPNVPDTGKHKK